MTSFDLAVSPLLLLSLSLSLSSSFPLAAYGMKVRRARLMFTSSQVHLLLLLPKAQLQIRLLPTVLSPTPKPLQSSPCATSLAFRCSLNQLWCNIGHCAYLVTSAKAREDSLAPISRRRSQVPSAFSTFLAVSSPGRLLDTVANH